MGMRLGNKTYSPLTCMWQRSSECVSGNGTAAVTFKAGVLSESHQEDASGAVEDPPRLRWDRGLEADLREGKESHTHAHIHTHTYTHAHTHMHTHNTHTHTHTWYPTFTPTRSPLSAATLSAMDIALIRRGWVTMILQPAPIPCST